MASIPPTEADVATQQIFLNQAIQVVEGMMMNCQIQMHNNVVHIQRSYAAYLRSLIEAYRFQLFINYYTYLTPADVWDFHLNNIPGFQDYLDVQPFIIKFLLRMLHRGNIPANDRRLVENSLNTYTPRNGQVIHRPFSRYSTIVHAKDIQPTREAILNYDYANAPQPIPPPPFDDQAYYYDIFRETHQQQV